MKRLVLCATLFASSAAIGGVNGLTVHSRANCANNETISWDLIKPHRLGTNSRHLINGQFVHEFTSGIAITRRSAAVHWGEGTGGWTVRGEHYLMKDKSNEIIGYSETYAIDCSIYDGWWDYKL